jgi:hypothetical protein
MKARILASLSFLGASAACLGIFLDWFVIQRVALEGGVTAGSAAGTDMTVGLVALVAAAVAAIFSILWLARGASQSLAAIVLVSSLAAGGLAGFVWATLGSRYVDYVAENTSSDLSGDEIRETLEPLVSEDQLKPEVERGVMLTSAGALVATLFSFFGALRPSPRRKAQDGRKEPRDVVQPEALPRLGQGAGALPLQEGSATSPVTSDPEEHAPSESGHGEHDGLPGAGPEPSYDNLRRRRSELGDTWSG